MGLSDIDFTELGMNFVKAARSQFKEFLAENQDVDDLVVQIGKSYAVRTAEYHLAATEEDREAARTSLRQLRNTMDLTLDGMAHLAKSAILAQLKAGLGMLLEFAIANLPTIIAMVRR